MTMQAPAPAGVLDLVLLHYPVLNRNGEIIGSAVTNLDLHDIARAAKTFGAGMFYIVTPFVDQQELFAELLEHWLTGPGSRANAKRGEALALVRICSTLADVAAEIEAEGHPRPVVLATSAREVPGRQFWPVARVRRQLEEGGRFLMLFGTAWGLAPEVLETADGILPPIAGRDEYNHLSVRSAVAIFLDRLLGSRD